MFLSLFSILILPEQLNRVRTSYMNATVERKHVKTVTKPQTRHTPFFYATIQLARDYSMATRYAYVIIVHNKGTSPWPVWVPLPRKERVRRATELKIQRVLSFLFNNQILFLFKKRK